LDLLLSLLFLLKNWSSYAANLKLLNSLGVFIPKADEGQNDCTHRSMLVFDYEPLLA
jgi:hypothetical protein